VPQIAHRAGYKAYYFTTADLGFEDAGAWLRGLAFDGVEGNENPYYASWPRSQFGAAADAALFARFEQWLEQRGDASPFVAVLLTTTSHPPFLNPLTNEIDPAGTFGYVDTQLVEFHDYLAHRGFFRDGILLLTGDHRSMTPIAADEYARFGERAFARVPMIVAGARDMPGVIDAAFQQADFPASLARLLGVEYCRSPFTGAFLGGPPSPARYVAHVRGDNRNRVDIYFDDRVAGYLEDGDASAWFGIERPSDADDVAAWINTQRIPRVQSAAQNPGALPSTQPVRVP
jgi:arylsulfatase A-like enzyme